MTLREQIKSRRQSIGMTQSQLAAAAGVAQSWISAYESGRRDATGQTLDRVITALGEAELKWRRKKPKLAG